MQRVQQAQQMGRIQAQQPVTNYQQPPQTQPQNNYEDAVSQAIAMAENGGNMQQELQKRMRQNPQQAQQFAQFMRQNRGRNVWDVAYELMGQRGVDPSKFGLPRR